MDARVRREGLKAWFEFLEMPPVSSDPYQICGYGGFSKLLRSLTFLSW